MRNPVPFLEEMRAEGPLVRAKIPVIGGIWLTTTQSAAAQVLKNDDAFRMRKADGKVAGMSWWMPSMLKRLTNNMLSSDEPEHARLRGLVDQAFRRRSVLDLADRIDDLAISGAQALFSNDRSADLVSKFARPLPLAVICELLGLPKEDHSKFSHWAGSLTSIRGVFSFLRGINQLRPLMRYIDERIVMERKEGGNGLIHDLINPENPDDQLSDDELVAMVFLLLLAGHETTTHLISGGVLALLEHPDQLEALKADWSGIDLAVEEMLRFVSPVQTGKPRFAREDIEIDGVKIKKNEMVTPFLVAANHDPAVFEAPEKFDITRKPNRHIEFGGGVHFCLGHQLARLEMKSAIRSLFESYPDLSLAEEGWPVIWNERFGLRALKRLVVRP